VKLSGSTANRSASSKHSPQRLLSHMSKKKRKQEGEKKHYTPDSKKKDRQLGPIKEEMSRSSVAKIPTLRQQGG